MSAFARCVAVILGGLLSVAVTGAGPARKASPASWATEFPTDPAKLASVGWNPYFILEPGHYRVLRGSREEIIKYESLELVDNGFRKGPAPGRTGSGS